MSILDELAAAARERVRTAERKITFRELKERARSLPKGTFAFEQALRKPELAFICECKKASPSKGLIDSEFPYLEIAREYEEAGAACVSVLTEPTRFLGKDEYLREIAASVSIPCLRKDFTVSEYQIWEAKLLGAEAVLLICAILPQETVWKYIHLCDSLGISALVETHTEAEVHAALSAGARILGVNNRNLASFTVDSENTFRLRKLVPRDVIFVSESGIQTAEDVRRLRDAGVDAVLIGETLMRASDRKKKLEELRRYA